MEAEGADRRALAEKAAKRRTAKGKKTSNSLYIALGIFGGFMALVIGFMVLNPELPPNKIPALDPSLIESANSAGLGYTQQANEHFKEWTMADVAAASNSFISQAAKHVNPCDTYNAEGELVPSTYDIREEFPDCMEPVAFMGNCSAGYALATASVLSERFCIQSNGDIKVSLSPQDILSCDPKSDGCVGGNIDTVWNNIRDMGLVEEHCFPYKSPNMTPGNCTTDKQTGCKTYKATKICATVTEQGIMREIKKHGPVVAAMVVYTDFLAYHSGVYRPFKTSSKIPGAHAVEIIGWGNDKDTQDPYWVIKNSWGEDWGEDGYARVLRGIRELGLEDYVVTGTPWLQEEESKPHVEQVEEPVDAESLDKS